MIFKLLIATFFCLLIKAEDFFEVENIQGSHHKLDQVKDKRDFVIMLLTDEDTNFNDKKIWTSFYGMAVN